jgi:hypothetical protein
MKQPSKHRIERLKAETSREDSWEKVESFTAAKPTSIRLSPQLIHDLERIALLRGEKSYQALLKRWVTERVQYEMELIDLAKSKKAI